MYESIVFEAAICRTCCFWEEEGRTEGNTKFRGEFLIHASKIPDKNAMKAFGFDKLPLGCIVGKAEITRVKKYQDVDEFNKDKELHLASQEWGNYGFVLENVKRMKEVPCKGKLGFWEFN
tara:strand:+ start:104 stop:463 length:360 start_codon:yes stop_codon:yes gene_type:complete